MHSVCAHTHCLCSSIERPEYPTSLKSLSLSSQLTAFPQYKVTFQDVLIVYNFFQISYISQIWMTKFSLSVHSCRLPHCSHYSSFPKVHTCNFHSEANISFLVCITLFIGISCCLVEHLNIRCSSDLSLFFFLNISKKHKHCIII